MARKSLCPVCKKEARRRAENASFPFCGAHCRMIDLGKWLGEEYRVPNKQSEETEDELPFQAPDDPAHRQN